MRDRPPTLKWKSRPGRKRVGRTARTARREARLLGLGIAPALALALVLPGCQIFGFDEEMQRLDSLPIIEGNVTSARAGEGNIVVVLGRIVSDTGNCIDDIAVVDHFVLESPGRWIFGVRDGDYVVGAFQDLDSNLTYESGEPVTELCGAVQITIDVGETVDGVEIAIPREGRSQDEGQRFSILDLEADATPDQGLVSFRQLIVYGEVRPLADDHFDPAWATVGLWKPTTFLLEVRPGVYFLQEYEKGRIPVLFVHGIGGHPREFAHLISKLDRERFQPWVYFYPSGLNLSSLGNKLVDIVAELRLVHGFDQLVVVAHSMGGLVARSYILEQARISGGNYVPLFVSISSPFGGMDSAQSGAESSPITLPDSMLDVATKSDFLARLWYLDPKSRTQPRGWPKGLEHHMIFGFQRQSNRFGESSDKTVAVGSQLRREAQRSASSVYGIDADHTGILRDPETSARLNALLSELRSRRWRISR